VGAYAAAVDARDLEVLRRLFLPDATLTVRRGGGEPEVHRGHAGLAGVIETLAPFEVTLHEVSGLVFEVAPGGEEAAGEAVCVAHHVRSGDDLALYGRYSDRFIRGGDGAWLFAARELRVLWTEKRPVRLA
jgi:hypothetical protein